MDIIGTGFIARHFERLRPAHPHVLLFASGVSRSNCTDELEFRREVDVLYSALHHCCLHRRKLVYFSTSSDLMYGGPGSAGYEDEPVFPRSAYGRHKLAMETVIRQSTCDYLILRLPSPVGRYQQPFQLVPALFQQIQRGMVQIRRNVRRDIIDIEDVVLITNELLEDDISRQVINVASGVAVLVEEIVDHLASHVSSLVLRSYTDGSDHYQVSNAKLLSYLKEPAALGFDQRYYQRVIDKYYASTYAEMIPIEGPEQPHRLQIETALATL